MSKLRVVNIPSQNKCQFSRGVFESFERLGIFVLSDKLRENTRCSTLVDITGISNQMGSLSCINDGHPDNETGGTNNYGLDIPDCVDEDDDNDGILDLEDPDHPSNIDTDADGIPDIVDLDDDNDGILDSGDDEVLDIQEEVRKPSVELRNYFPETWLFDLVELDANGEKTLELEAPHTITTWVAETVCTDNMNGAQVSGQANLLVTQDFFLDLNMPYSIKRGEKFSLNISIFNTINHKLPMTITFSNAQEYKVGREKYSFCLEPHDNQIESFVVKAQELYEVNITVEAKISASENTGCNDKIGNVDGYSDSIQKPIQVKPEGFPIEKVESEFVCRKENDSKTIVNMAALTLPGKKELVKGSARAWVTVTGDILAPTLSNLEKLLKQPTGCGEQVKHLAR